MRNSTETVSTVKDAGQREHHGIDGFAPDEPLVHARLDPFFVVATIIRRARRVDHDGQAEQNQPQLHQRATGRLAGGLAELVGDDRGDGVARRKKRSVNAWDRFRSPW